MCWVRVSSNSACRWRPTTRAPSSRPWSGECRSRGRTDSGLDLLYLHGWSDYFFQTELADFWAAQGVRFYAIDLRKYGRSRRPEQTPGFVTDLATYDEDLEAALAVMGHGAATSRPAGCC